MLNQKIRNAFLLSVIVLFAIAGYFITRPKTQTDAPQQTADIAGSASNGAPTMTLPVVPKDLNLTKKQLELSQKLQQAQELERADQIDKAVTLYNEIANTPATGEVISAFTVPAQAAAMNLQCLKRRGPNYSTSEIADLQKLVLGALKSGIEAKIKYYAACNFYIGEIGALEMKPLEPEQAIKRFLGIAKTASWQKTPHRLSSFALLTSSTQIYQLAFQHINDRWYWTGFYFAHGAKVY